ncbi:tenascin isoform X2 [Bicyclus anynana]|uniref:Tenascin isoform X2 n=1 Tax=Bicyclus anynana TaxID=110368 RepID=A0A6J1NQB1_BICAN|nr:tenascin isoform X2 [Bicyclus anynana]
MFRWKVIVFIAAIFAVNAAVINVYDDDVKTFKTKVHGVKSCNEAACKVVCRMLGFNTGTCDGDTCECSKLHNNDEQTQRNTIPSLDEVKTEQIEHNEVTSVDENEIGEGVRGCDPVGCDQLCRRLKFPGGVCVNGRCKCDNFRLQTEAVIENTMNDVSKCNGAACSAMCHRLGYRYGVCVNDNVCRCSNALSDEQIEHNEVPSVDENDIGEGVRGCDPVGCDQLCRRLKFPGGVCVNGRCKCDNFRLQTEAVIEYTMNDVSKCNGAACSAMCHRLGYRYGVCVNDNVCRCSNALSDEEAVVNTIKDCDKEKCNHFCQRLGFQWGWCDGGLCRCSYARTEETVVNSMKEAYCDSDECNQTCIRLGYRWGICFGNICKCAWPRTEAFEFVPDLEENKDIANTIEFNLDTFDATPVRDCDQLACIMGCREIGFPGGTCFLDKCHCDNYQDDKKENLESVQECNNVNCVFKCRSWGYIGGRCLDGRCLCV